MGKLVLQLADGTTQDVPLGKERMTIGRRADNDVCLPFPAVSGEHASVVTILADSFLEDLGSTNGTLVNGKPIAKHFLRDHDQIDIGRQRMVFMSDDNARVDPLPVDGASSRLLGLEARVEAARPAPPAAVPPAGQRRETAANPPLLVLPDLQEDELFAMGVSIQGLMIHFRNSLGIIRLIRSNPAYPEDIEKVIQHHMDFSLRGLGVPEAFPQPRN